MCVRLCVCGGYACVTVNMVCVWYEECVSGSMYDYMVC